MRLYEHIKNPIICSGFPLMDTKEHRANLRTDLEIPCWNGVSLCIKVNDIGVWCIVILP